jgi:hypothetical protein
LKNLKPLPNEAYNISNSTSILNETLIIELFKGQNKTIDAFEKNWTQSQTIKSLMTLGRKHII